MQLAEQAIVVTGGNGGLGRGMAEGLVLAGAHVSIWARDEAKSAATALRLRELAPDRTVVSVRCDVTDPAQVAAALEQTVAAFGRIDACIANAGISGEAPFLDLSLEEWRRVTATNLDGAFLTLQAAARQMVAQGDGGALVAVSSTSAMQGAPNNAHYAASKAGVIALVRSMAVALARHDIRVNVLVPGLARTDMTRDHQADDRFVEAMIKRTPTRRWAEADDVRAIAVYLCDKRHVFHTGDSVVVDGGYTIA